MLRSILVGLAALSLVSCGPMVSVTPPQSGGSTSPGTLEPGINQPEVILPDTVDAPTIVDRAADAVARADVAVDRAWAAYVRIRDVANLVVPFLPANRADQVRAIQGRIEAAFARARVATDLAVKASELALVGREALRLEDLTVDKD